MIEVKLWNLEHFLGMLVPGPTGVRYEQQAGGTLCTHPALEGAYIPLDDTATDSARAWLRDYAGPYDAELVEKFLSYAQLDVAFRPLAPEAVPFWLAGLPPWFRKDYMLFEAWVPVIVRDDPGNEAALVGKCVVLVYPNSD